MVAEPRKKVGQNLCNFRTIRPGNKRCGFLRRCLRAGHEDDERKIVQNPEPFTTPDTGKTAKFRDGKTRKRHAAKTPDSPRPPESATRSHQSSLRPDPAARTSPSLLLRVAPLRLSRCHPCR